MAITNKALVQKIQDDWDDSEGCTSQEFIDEALRRGLIQTLPESEWPDENSPWYTFTSKAEKL